MVVAKETVLWEVRSKVTFPDRPKSVWRPRPDVTPFSREKICWGLQGEVSGTLRRETEDKVSFLQTFLYLKWMLTLYLPDPVSFPSSTVRHLFSQFLHFSQTLSLVLTFDFLLPT